MAWSSALNREKQKSILIIPHQPHRGLKVRALEMAKYLAEQEAYQVSVLTWETGKPVAGILDKVLVRTQEALQTSRKKIQFVNEGPLTWVSLPYLTSPYPDCQKFNESQLEKLLRQQHYDAVISANAYLFPVPGSYPGRYLYDVVDDHLSPDSGPAWKKTRAFTLNELRKAQRIITISYGLQGLLRQQGYPNAQVLPNGVDLKAFRAVSEEAITAVKRKWNGEGKFIVSYIGNHGWWSGMEFILETFRKFHAEFPESQLLVVGPGEDLESFKQRYPDDSICFTGPVPPDEVAAYFHASDVGVLPFQPCPFTDHALPLKILEYGAARKPIIASPLRELKTLGFPHVQLVELEMQSWVSALMQLAQNRQAGKSDWGESWNQVIKPYDWPLIWKNLLPWLES